MEPFKIGDTVKIIGPIAWMDCVGIIKCKSHSNYMWEVMVEDRGLVPVNEDEIILIESC